MTRHWTPMSGSFRYEAVLPVPIAEQAVTAALKDGVLTITMPKSATTKATCIDVKCAERPFARGHAKPTLQLSGGTSGVAPGPGVDP